MMGGDKRGFVGVERGGGDSVQVKECVFVSSVSRGAVNKILHQMPTECTQSCSGNPSMQ